MLRLMLAISNSPCFATLWLRLKKSPESLVVFAPQYNAKGIAARPDKARASTMRDRAAQSSVLSTQDSIAGFTRLPFSQ